MPNLIPVTDIDDPQIAAYRNVRDRDLAGTHGGRFVAEGETVLAVALSPGRHRMESLLIAENRIAALARLLEGSTLPTYVASPVVMDAIVGSRSTGGCLVSAYAASPSTPRRCWRAAPPSRSASVASPTTTTWAASSATPPPSAPAPP